MLYKKLKNGRKLLSRRSRKLKRSKFKTKLISKLNRFKSFKSSITVLGLSCFSNNMMKKHLIFLNELGIISYSYFLQIEANLSIKLLKYTVIIKINMYKYKHVMKGIVKKVIPDKVV